MGMMIMMCGNIGKSHEAFSTTAENMELPLVNWDLAPTLPADEAHNMLVISIERMLTQ